MVLNYLKTLSFNPGHLIGLSIEFPVNYFCRSWFGDERSGYCSAASKLLHEALEHFSDYFIYGLLATAFNHNCNHNHNHHHHHSNKITSTIAGAAVAMAGSYFSTYAYNYIVDEKKCHDCNEEHSKDIDIYKAAIGIIGGMTFTYFADKYFLGCNHEGV